MEQTLTLDLAVPAEHAAEIAARLPETTYHLGLTQGGHPRHPLYVSYRVTPSPWPRAARYAALQTPLTPRSETI